MRRKIHTGEIIRGFHYTKKDSILTYINIDPPGHERLFFHFWGKLELLMMGINILSTPLIGIYTEFHDNCYNRYQVRRSQSGEGLEATKYITTQERGIKGKFELFMIGINFHTTE